MPCGSHRQQSAVSLYTQQVEHEDFSIIIITQK